MTKRSAWKLVGLMAAGGVLFQGVGCIPVAAQVIIEDLATVLIQQLVFRSLGAPLPF